MAKAQDYVYLTRPQNALGGVFLYSFGYFLVDGQLAANFLYGLAILLILHSVATLQNDIEDYDIDRANKRQSALQNRSLSSQNAYWLILSLMAFALLSAVLSGQPRLNLLIVGMFLAVASLYNLKPFRVSRRPLSSIVIMGLCYGAFPFIYGYWLAGGGLSKTLVVLASLFFLGRFSTSILKDYKDATGDKLFGKQTFYLHYGAKITAWTSILTAALANLGILVMLVWRGSGSRIFFITLLLATILAGLNIWLRLSLTKTRSEKQLAAIFIRCAINQTRFEGAVLLCLLAS